MVPRKNIYLPLRLIEHAQDGHEIEWDWNRRYEAGHLQNLLRAILFIGSGGDNNVQIENWTLVTMQNDSHAANDDIGNGEPFEQLKHVAEGFRGNGSKLFNTQRSHRLRRRFLFLYLCFQIQVADQAMQVIWMYAQDFCGFRKVAVRLTHRAKNDLLLGLHDGFMIFRGRLSND